MTPDEFKSLINQISALINKRAETTEQFLQSKIAASEERIESKITASEERIKEELRVEILASRAEAKSDTLSLEAKLFRKVQSHERRVDNLEKATNTPNPDKN